MNPQPFEGLQPWTFDGSIVESIAFNNHVLCLPPAVVDRYGCFLILDFVAQALTVATEGFTSVPTPVLVLAGDPANRSAFSQATMPDQLATGILALDQRLKGLDTQMEALFVEHPQAEIIQSMPGFGPFLGACLLVSAGNLRAFPVVGLGRPFGNVDHVRDPVLALPDLPRRPPHCPTGPQAPGQLLFQGAAGLHIQRLVDGFVLTCISG